uniref:Uncharacterized protein n=1 Tax=Physcomitrium patens TaxID=3218 RepID=A0A7I4EWD9_PHYPA
MLQRSLRHWFLKTPTLAAVASRVACQFRFFKSRSQATSVLSGAIIIPFVEFLFKINF